MTCSVADVVVAIGGMSLEELRAEWRRRYGAPPPLRSVPIMRQLLAWRVQADVLGGLDADTRRLLARSGPVEAEGKQIGTIEGMAQGETLHPLQRKFLEMAALQCGICTPGVLISARALLEKNPDPTEEEVRFGLAGNLCRCTGYDKIVRAVLETAAEMRGAA